MSSESRPDRAAQPRLQGFDPWVAVSAGHQVAESSSGTQWRRARNKKLGGQLSAGPAGGKREYDQVGPGADNYDGKLAGVAPRAAKSTGQINVKDMLMNPGIMKEKVAPKPAPTAYADANADADHAMVAALRTQQQDAMADKAKTEVQDTKLAGKMIFNGVTAYVNGSTYPLISDHKLKYLLAEHGGSISLHLGRRSVTHVIVGRLVGRAGAGGGLAGGKLEKEIRKLGGKGIKYVGAEWLLESVKAGKRLPETRFEDLRIARHGQGSVYGMLSSNGDKPTKPRPG